MVNTIYYTGEFKPVEINTRKLDNVVDVWVRRNPITEIDEEGNEVKCAEEIHLTYEIAEAPTQEKIESQIDALFEKEMTPETTLDDVVAAVNELANIIFGGEM